MVLGAAYACWNSLYLPAGIFEPLPSAVAEYLTDLSPLPTPKGVALPVAEISCQYYRLDEHNHLIEPDPDLSRGAFAGRLPLDTYNVLAKGLRELPEQYREVGLQREPTVIYNPLKTPSISERHERFGCKVQQSTVTDPASQWYAWNATTFQASGQQDTERPDSKKVVPQLEPRAVCALTREMLFRGVFGDYPDLPGKGNEGRARQPHLKCGCSGPGF